MFSISCIFGTTEWDHMGLIVAKNLPSKAFCNLVLRSKHKVCNCKNVGDILAGV